VAQPWLRQTLLISGRVQNRQAYRAALAQVNELVQALQAWPAAEVIVRQWPVDIRSDAAIKPAAEQQSAPSQADFVIELNLPPAAQMNDTERRP
jgi:hypothetical protein